MQYLLIGGGIVAVLLLVWLLRRGSSAKDAPARGKVRASDALDTLVAWHPQATRILTTSEREAYALLRNALPEHIILAQVSLARFLKVPTRHSYAEWLRRVGVLCADLVVCDSASQVVAVVDVRAPEAQENDRARKRHTRMERVLKAADISLHVWREGAMPGLIGVRSSILGISMEAAEASLERSPLAKPSTAPAKVLAGDPAREPVTVIYEDGEQRDPPSSTWFDEFDSGAVPLSPSPPMPPRGGGPSLR